ncbi:MAG: ABC transporter permease subunit [Phycisphaerales bacterium]|nr:ABC transporter permease subunit [Planctomycetota bacterium]
MLTSLVQLFTRGLFGPIFEREVRVVGRRKSTYWVRGAYVLGLAALATLVYFVITADLRFGTSSRAEALLTLQSFAPALAAFYIWFQFLALCFVSSTLTAGTICDERRKGSFSALLTTPLTLSQILLGKLAGRLTQTFILLAAGLPLLLATRVFGGVSVQFIAAAFAITASVALLHASVAITASCRMRTATAASSSGLLVGILWCLLPLIASLIAAILRFNTVSQHLLTASPYVALGLETAASFGVIGPQGKLFPWYFGCWYALAGALLFLLTALFRLRHIARLAGEPSAAPQRRKAKPGKHRTAQHTGSMVSNNPVLWRELRQPLFFKPWYPWAGTLLIAGVLGFGFYHTSWADTNTVIFVSVIGLLLWGFQSAVIATGSIAGERESRSLEVLLTTPMTARSIIRAKWLGALRKIIPAPLFLFVFLLICGPLSAKLNWVLLPHLALLTVPPAALFCAIGLWLSVVCRRAVTSSTINILIALGLWAALPMLGAAIAAITGSALQAQTQKWTFYPLLLINPAPMCLTAFNGAQEQIWSGPGIPRYQSFYPFTLYSFTVASICYAAGYSLLTAIALWGASRALARRTNRAV